MAAKTEFRVVPPLQVEGGLFTKSGPIPVEENVFGAQHGFIISLHYNPIEIESTYVNFRTIIPAVTRKDLALGDVAIAEVPDCVEMVTTGDISTPKIHRGIDLARVFINDQISSMLGVNLNAGKDKDGKTIRIMPGIGVSPTKIPDDAFLQNLLLIQERFNNQMINQATVYHQQGKQAMITDDHRKAARYMDVDVEWLPKPVSLSDSKECISCAETIKAAAANCKHCGAPQKRDLYNRWMESKFPVAVPPQLPAQPPAK